MAPARKSRSVNKRFSNEVSPEKDVGSSSKSKQRKKKLSDKLGPQWNKSELERFYEAYRKHGKDWKKVAAAVRNRSVEMVEALYNMNRAYLSLPEGTASVVGLIAMMTDHYSVLEGSDSERESDDASRTPQKLQKRKRPKVGHGNSKDEVNHSQPIASADGCLSFLKHGQAYGMQPRATRKRTPRVPVSYSSKRDDEGYSPQNKKARRSADDHFAQKAALTLTEALNMGESPRPHMPSKKKESGKSSLIGGWAKMFGQPGEAESNLCDMEGVGTVEVLRKGKKLCGKKVKVEDYGVSNSDDGGEACSGTEEGVHNKSLKGKVDPEVSNFKRGRLSPLNQRKKSKKIFVEDELHALQALADLSMLMLPTSTMESGSSARLKEEKAVLDMDDKSSTPDATSTSHQKDMRKQTESKEKVHAIIGARGPSSRKPKPGKYLQNDVTPVTEAKQQPQSAASWNRKHKSSPLKIQEAEAQADNEEVAEVEKKPVVKTKRTGQVPSRMKQQKAVRASEDSSSNSDLKRQGTDISVSTAHDPPMSPVGLQKISQNRRKRNLKNVLRQEGMKFPKDTFKIAVDKDFHSQQASIPSNLTRQSCFLSCPWARRWCKFEWFYSTVDYPWFSKREFDDYLNHVGLGHVPGLTRVEWSVIKSSLGRPRRFSQKFLLEEREKLQQYRESVRKHYTEFRSGVKEGLPTDLAPPLSVGNRVIAIHPKTREIHDGKVLTVDHNKCSILFDRTDLGVEFVSDIDCMPSNPMDYLPEVLKGLNVSSDKRSLVSQEQQMNGHLKFGGSVFPSVGPDNAIFALNPLAKQVNINYAISQSKASVTNGGGAQQGGYSQQPCNTTYGKASDSEIKALNPHLDGKTPYMLNMRPGSASQGKALPGQLKTNSLESPFASQELEAEVLGIVKGSRSRAHAMVDAAIKAVSSVKEGEDAFRKIGEALDSIGRHQSTSGSTNPAKHQEYANGSLDHHIKSPSVSKVEIGPEKTSAQIPLELITSCVSTWLMIQACTERQYPPAEVAQIIDSAITSLHPRCPQNMPVYQEIQMCMGRIKTQILALIPT